MGFSRESCRCCRSRSRRFYPRRTTLNNSGWYGSVDLVGVVNDHLRLPAPSPENSRLCIPRCGGMIAPKVSIFKDRYFGLERLVFLLLCIYGD